MKKFNKRTVAYISFCAVLLVSFASFPRPAQADLASTKRAEQQAQAEKAQIQQTINQNNQEKAAKQAAADHLQQEVDALSASIAATQNTINTINHDIDVEKQTIADLTKQIDKQQQLVTQKENDLEHTMQAMYMEDATANNAIEQFFQGNTISDAVANQQSYQAVEVEVEKAAQEIKALKATLEAKQIEHIKAQTQLNEKQDQAQQQKQALQSQQNLQRDLLAQTNATIAQIDQIIKNSKDQLKAVDGKISQFLAEITTLSQGYSAAAGDVIVTNSQNWHYSQTDPRWAGTRLDPSSSYSDTFAESGCLITSITMAINSRGVNKTPPQVLADIRAAGGMYGDLFAWDGVAQASNGKLDLTTGGKERMDWGSAVASLRKGQYVVVHITPRSSVNTSLGWGHWILLTGVTSDGKYTAEDPYFAAGRVYPSSWFDYMARLTNL